MKEVHVYSPATIANVACGFDVLGLALNEPVEKMILRKSSCPGVHIKKISGADLPKQSNRNVVGVVLEEILQHIPKNKLGIEVEIYKTIRPGSGIGSSASSAAGAAVGANILFETNFKPIELIEFALEGEKLACGSKHADNVAPAILGGVALVRCNFPLEIVSLPSPEKIWVTIIYPNIEIKTSYARSIIPKIVSLKNTIRQMANVGAFVSALYSRNNHLLSRSLEDFIAEPHRSILIPEFYVLKNESMKVGAIGGGISGSGPSVFMFSESKETAEKVARSMSIVYNALAIRLDYKIYITTINNTGVQYTLK